MVTGDQACPGNNVCNELTAEGPIAECVSICNNTEYSAIFNEPYCKHDYPCCQADLASVAKCHCKFYTSGYVSRTEILVTTGIEQNLDRKK